MKLYAGALQARRDMFNQSTITACSCSLFANNEDEAVGAALRLAREEYEEENGWYGHAVSVVEIEEKIVRDWLDAE